MKILIKILKFIFKGKTVSGKTISLSKTTVAKAYNVVRGADISLKISTVVELDTVLSQALKDLYALPTFKDNLIKAKNRFDSETYDKLWDAHKIRNRIIHAPHMVNNEKTLNFAIYSLISGIKKLS